MTLDPHERHFRIASPIDGLQLFLRHLPPHKDGVPLWWKVGNRNKKGVTLDVRTAEGRALLLRMLPGFDVLVENGSFGSLQVPPLGFTGIVVKLLAVEAVPLTSTMDTLQPDVTLAGTANVGVTRWLTLRGPSTTPSAVSLRCFRSRMATTSGTSTATGFLRFGGRL